MYAATPTIKKPENIFGRRNNGRAYRFYDGCKNIHSMFDTAQKVLVLPRKTVISEFSDA